MTFDAQPVQNATPASNLNPGTKTFKSKPSVSPPDMTFDSTPVSEDTHADNLPDPNSKIFHDSEGKNYRVPKNMLKWATDNGYQPGPYEDTQAYKYSQYGLDVKGKISNAQMAAAQKYDIDKGNFQPYTGTGDDSTGQNNYEPSDDALKSVGVDPKAYRNNKSTAVIRAVTGKAVPRQDENGNILGDSGSNPIKGLRTGVTNLLSLPGQVYHAFTDDPRTPEEADRPTGTLGIHRLFIDPNVDLLQKSAKAFREGHVSQGLGYGASGLIPVVGPTIAHMGEAIGEDPIEGTFEGATYLEAPKILKAARGLAGTAVDAGLSKISNLAGQATPGVVSTVANVAGKATGAVVKTGVKAGVAAAPYVGDYLSGLTESLTGAVTDKIVDLTKGTAQDAMNAMKSIRDTAMQKLADNGITGDAADAAANDLMKRIQDQYLESGKPPSVSGGAPDDVAGTTGEAPKTSSVLRDLHGTVSDWVSSLNEKLNVPDDATPIARAANTAAGQGLKEVATPGQMTGGLPAFIEKWFRQEPYGVGQHIADKFDVPARAAAEGSLNKAIDNISPETAGWSQADRAGLFSHANLVEGEVPGGIPPEVMDALQNLSKVLGQKGIPMLQEPGQIFKSLEKMSPDDFNRSVSGLSPEQVEAVRQGYVRHLADSTLDPETGSYHLGLMKKIIDQNRGKLGTHWGEFKPLGDGLAELEQHMKMSNTKARSLLQSTVGAGVAGVVAVVLEGAHPGKVLGTMALEYAGYKFLAPRVVDLLMKPRAVGDLNIMFRAASKVPESSLDDKSIKKAAANVKKSFVNPLIKQVSQAFQKKPPFKADEPTP